LIRSIQAGSRGRLGSLKRHAGFTLIEVVVAFVLLALVFSTGFEIFSKGLQRAGAIEERSRALEVASSRLEDAGLEGPIAEGVTQGESRDPRFHWTRAIGRYDVGDDPNHPVTGPYVLYRIQVRVDWRGGDGRVQSLDLSTLQLAQRPT
jgi:general secretion pathway protein I